MSLVRYNVAGSPSGYYILCTNPKAATAKDIWLSMSIKKGESSGHVVSNKT